MESCSGKQSAFRIFWMICISWRRRRESSGRWSLLRRGGEAGGGFYIKSGYDRENNSTERVVWPCLSICDGRSGAGAGALPGGGQGACPYADGEGFRDA